MYIHTRLTSSTYEKSCMRSETGSKPHANVIAPSELKLSNSRDTLRGLSLSAPLLACTLSSELTGTAAAAAHAGFFAAGSFMTFIVAAFIVFFVAFMAFIALALFASFMAFIAPALFASFIAFMACVALALLAAFIAFMACVALLAFIAFMAPFAAPSPSWPSS